MSIMDEKKGELVIISFPPFSTNVGTKIMYEVNLKIHVRR